MASDLTDEEVREIFDEAEQEGPAEDDEIEDMIDALNEEED